ncbi:hypothetical protein F9U64_01215 [Gracilibacillus oryzae]|uniref:Uncharacterized protein n=1 Tax=Gracilibacillus oryzae TaxID=1672701 RepID=A0A7C8GVN1_9BACI|nr:hypothetical protein [Gracilibacillus oryzae]KAB8139273.1 hypothetical protein F9U64_01215 [Gracilibacillus oryzae]
MPGITVYPQYMEESIGKGRLAEYPETRADSGAAAESINWGVGVEYSGDEQVVTYAGGTFRGIALAQTFGEYRVNNISDDIEGAYEQYDAVSFLRKGIVWVEVEEEVSKGDAAVCDSATGNFRAEGTEATTISGVVGEFKSSAVAGELAKLEINLP